MSVRILTMATVVLTSVAFATTTLAQSCSSGGKSTAVSTSDKLPDVVATAIAADGFKTLVAAVKAADLVAALQADGPFTVFAPSDAAFAKLPKGTLESLLKPENKSKLAAILTYHVVPAHVEAASVMKMNGAISLNGQRLSFMVDDNGVSVNGARVVKTDIQCGNGVIHVIDTVMLPTDKDIVASAQQAGIFQTLLTAAKAAGLADVLAHDGPFTVFAPTDEAFAKLPAGTIAKLLEPASKEQLAKILKLHVVAGRVYSDQAAQAGTAKSLAMLPLTFAGASKLTVNGAKIVRADLDASNGVIHVIDAVLLP